MVWGLVPASSLQERWNKIVSYEIDKKTLKAAYHIRCHRVLSAPSLVRGNMGPILSRKVASVLKVLFDKLSCPSNDFLKIFKSCQFGLRKLAVKQRRQTIHTAFVSDRKKLAREA